jgi:hypothetical protein
MSPKTGVRPGRFAAAAGIITGSGRLGWKRSSRPGGPRAWLGRFDCGDNDFRKEQTMKMVKWMSIGMLVLLLSTAAVVTAADKEIAGVKFAAQKQVAGKTLTLNGVAVRKAFGFIKVFAGGLYLENPTTDANAAIASEEVKQFHLHYLTSKATAKKLQDGFKEAMAEANPPALVEAHRADIDRYASWLDQDMAPGATSITTYEPGKGLTLVFKGQEKGTIAGKEFARMYFRYNLGEKANASLRKGYLAGK